MKSFASAIIAATAAAEFMAFDSSLDGSSKNYFLSAKSWSEAEVTGGSVKIHGNNSLFLRSAESMDNSALVKPYLLGGSIEYDVELLD